MRSLSVRRAVLAAGTFLAIAGLGACGSDGPAASDPVVATTSASASPSDDASPLAGATIGTAAFADLVSGLTNGTTAHLHASVTGSGGLGIDGVLDLGAHPPEMSVTIIAPAVQGTYDVRVVDGTTYLHSDKLGTDKWVQVDRNDPSLPLGDLKSELDPTVGLEKMLGAIDTVTYEGVDDLDGESLPHYAVTMDTAAYLDSEGLAASGAAAAHLPATVRYDLWVDDQGRLRKSVLNLGDLGVATYELSQVGEPVHIVAPPESEILTLPPGWMQGTSGA